MGKAKTEDAGTALQTRKANANPPALPFVVQHPYSRRDWVTLLKLLGAVLLQSDREVNT